MFASLKHVPVGFDGIENVKSVGSMDMGTWFVSDVYGQNKLDKPV